MTDGELLSLETLAARLGLPQTWLREQADAGQIPVIRIRKRRLFDLGSVRETLIERSRAEVGNKLDTAKSNVP